MLLFTPYGIKSSEPWELLQLLSTTATGGDFMKPHDPATYSLLFSEVDDWKWILKYEKFRPVYAAWCAILGYDAPAKYLFSLHVPGFKFDHYSTVIEILLLLKTEVQKYGEELLMAAIKMEKLYLIRFLVGREMKIPITEGHLFARGSPDIFEDRAKNLEIVVEATEFTSDEKAAARAYLRACMTNDAEEALALIRVIGSLQIKAAGTYEALRRGYLDLLADLCEVCQEARPQLWDVVEVFASSQAYWPPRDNGVLKEVYEIVARIAAIRGNGTLLDTCINDFPIKGFPYKLAKWFELAAIAGQVGTMKYTLRAGPNRRAISKKLLVCGGYWRALFLLCFCDL